MIAARGARSGAEMLAHRPLPEDRTSSEGRSRGVGARRRAGVLVLRRQSSVLLDGPSRAPARSMLHAIGFSEADLKKPLVGVAHCWTETMPCNFNHREIGRAHV